MRIRMTKITLKALRVNKGLTIAQASKMIGVSAPTLSSWENGKTYPDVNQLPIIEEVYGAKYDSIKFLRNITV